MELDRLLDIFREYNKLPLAVQKQLDAVVIDGESIEDQSEKTLNFIRDFLSEVAVVLDGLDINSVIDQIDLMMEESDEKLGLDEDSEDDVGDLLDEEDEEL